MNAKLSIMLILISTFLISFQCFAGSTTGKISYIYAGPSFGTTVLIGVNSAITSRPACSSSNLYQFAINTDQSSADTWLSMLMLAYASQSEVLILGTGSCTHNSGVEDLNLIRLNPK